MTSYSLCLASRAPSPFALFVLPFPAAARCLRIGLNKPALNQTAGQEGLCDPGSVAASSPDESGLPGGGTREGRDRGKRGEEAGRAGRDGGGTVEGLSK